jgi:polysaccharide pyruvyl transferase WcaK-like protein
MAPASSVVATRYHNVMCALKLGKPAISLGYSDKNISLMEDMGLPEFCQHANDIRFDHLVEQFATLEKNADAIQTIVEERNAELAARLSEQFTLLDATLFPGS